MDFQHAARLNGWLVGNSDHTLDVTSGLRSLSSPFKSERPTSFFRTTRGVTTTSFRRFQHRSAEVKWLLMARADAEKPVEGDLTPLRLAARFGNDEVVESGPSFLTGQHEASDLT